MAVPLKTLISVILGLVLVTLFIVLMTLYGLNRKSEQEQIEDEDNKVKNCYADRLKVKGLLEANVTTGLFDNETCSMQLAALRSDLMKNIREENGDDASCAEAKLDQTNFFHQNVKKVFYEKSTELSDIIREEKIKESTAVSSKILQGAIDQCRTPRVFAELFDVIFENSDKDIAALTPQDEYCAIKYAVDKHLLDTNVYKVFPNPKNINLKSVNCTDTKSRILEPFNNKLSQTLNAGIKDEKLAACRLQKAELLEAVDLTLAISLLKDLRISMDQKTSERRKFIDRIRIINENLKSC
ncbi:unnamed protein product [Diamesa tonsa]